MKWKSNLLIITIALIILVIPVNSQSSLLINEYSDCSIYGLCNPVNIIPSYGEMHFHNDSANGFPLTIPSSDTWVNITGFNDSGNMLENFTINTIFNKTNNALICKRTGRYKSSYSIATGNQGNNQEYQFQISVNGVRQHNTDTHRKIGSAGDVGSASGIGSFQCNAGDMINLMTKNVDGSANLEIHSVTVIIEEIGI